VIAGSDPDDIATRDADAHETDYVAALKPDALAGAHIGVLRGAVSPSPRTDPVFEQALGALRAAGAILVDVQVPGGDAQKAQLSQAKSDAFHTEFRVAIDTYLASTPPSVKARTLQDLIEFNARTPAETALFGQEIFEASATSPDITDPAYLAQRALAQRLAGPEGLDRMMQTAQVEAIVAQTAAPASVVDPVNGSSFFGSPSTLPAAAGYPHLTVPMGHVNGLPVGLSFIGPRWSDARILSLGYAFEQRTHAWREPAFPPTISVRAEIANAYKHP